MPDHPIPGPTPSGYQRTTGGQFSWTVPEVAELQNYFPQYEIQGLQGQGGMGAVFRAHQKSLDRLVAIKVLPAGQGVDSNSFAERFKNEARTMARLDHPGIVHVHDFGETDKGLLYFVMEFIEGSDVQDLLSAQGALTPAYALPITLHVCDALAYAHAHGVIHRDIKPANIMLTKEGRVKVADFGLARLDDPAQPGLTQTGMAMGTPDYVAPEALSASGDVDARADLYAIGVMLCHMLTGEVPRGIFELPSKRIPGIDPRIDAVITKAMKQRPEERYQTALELRDDIQAIFSSPKSASQSGPGSGPVSAALDVTVESAKSNRRVLWGVAAALLVGVVALVMSRPGAAPDNAGPTIAEVPHREVESLAPLMQASENPNLTLDATKWLPFTYPGDFGKVDGGITPTEAGAVTVYGGYGQRLRATWRHQDVAVRARVMLPADGVGLIGLRTDMNKPALRAEVHPDRIDIVSEAREDMDASDVTILRSFPGISGPFYEKEGAQVTFAVLDTECSLWVAGKYLASVSNNTAVEGKVLFDGINATYRDMQWQVIGDTSAPPPAVVEKEAPIVVTAGVWNAVRFPGDRPPNGRWQDGVLVLSAKEQCKLPSAFQGRDAAIRARITVKSGDGSFKGVYFKLRNDNALGFFDLTNSQTAHVGAQPDFAKDLVQLGTSPKGLIPLGKKDLLVEFAVVGDVLILTIEGKTAATGTITQNPEGNRAKPPFHALLQAGWNESIFRQLEFMPLDGVSRDKHPDFIKTALAAKTAPVVAKVAPTPAPAPAKPTLPAELIALEKAYLQSIQENVTSPHVTALAQLNGGFLAALDRAVTARQLTGADIAADKKTIADKEPLPPDTESTPDVLKTYRDTYRAKASELDDTRTTAHLGLLTPYITSLRQLEAELAKADRTADADAVKAYRDALSENPLALPRLGKP